MRGEVSSDVWCSEVQLGVSVSLISKGSCYAFGWVVQRIYSQNESFKLIQRVEEY